MYVNAFIGLFINFVPKTPSSKKSTPSICNFTPLKMEFLVRNLFELGGSMEVY